MKREWAYKNIEKTRIDGRERMRKWRELNPEKTKEASERAGTKRVANGKVKEYSKGYHKTHRHVGYAQLRASVAQKRGELLKLPCSICGDQNSEKHHPDYTKPLEVTWLCPKHHRRLHRWIN